MSFYSNTDMELHRVHKTLHHTNLGEEKHQMLNLNRRLEAYLSRVKLLEEENALLAKEIQALRCSSHGVSTRRKGLEEELRQARMEVDAAWRDRIYTELEVCRVAEELRNLDLQRQREAQAHVEAKKKLEQSRKELEEEQRAQMWLREKVHQLEHEMRHLIETHQEDVAHLEATLTQSRATLPPTLAERENQTPHLLQLGQEYAQRTTRAWQEAAEAYQGQLDQLEESLNQARTRLTLLGQEKSESQLKLRDLENEVTSAHNVRLHLEKTAAQQGDRYSQEIQQLQEHLEGLEVEKRELGQQMDHLLLETRGLQQQKMSLGLEVAAYRALLDSESLRGDIASRNVSIKDAVFSPWGVKKNYQTQLSASHKTTSMSSVNGITGRPRAITATPMWSRKPVTLTETPQIPMKPAYEDPTKSATCDTPYPKILQDGAVENFRPQEVHEEVTYAEPLSPPSEQEDKEAEEDWNSVGVESPVIESVVSHQVESGLSTGPAFSDEVDQHQLTPYHVRMTEEPCAFSHGSDEGGPAEKTDMREPHAPLDAWVEKKEEEHVQEEASDSETEAVLEPNFDSRTSSPVSECEPEDNFFSKVTEFSRNENLLLEDTAEISQDFRSSTGRTHEMDIEDRLYPDGEEMDTWDSVIERKIDLKTDDGMKKDEEKQQHAEPEEDISAREQEHHRRETRKELIIDVQQDDKVVSSLIDGQHVARDQEDAPLPDNKDDEEEEDSQNVSVSWQTELESDSYAQDNTLADTRPLIRYKSDETDANTQASHMDESESSEGEQEKKIGEVGTWSEGKSKRFGTMEDLCEEVEGEALDEEYNVGYTDVGDVMTVGDCNLATLLKNAESEEETVRKVGERHLGEETEELPEPTVATCVVHDEELETDRLVEQELENLTTDIYSAHFAQQQVSESEEMTEQEEPGTSSCAEPKVKVDHQLASSTAITDQPHENLNVSDLSVVMSQLDTPADEEVQHRDQDVIDAPEKREEEDGHDVSMVTHADGLTDFTSMPDMEETNNSVLQVTADDETLQDAAASTEVTEVEAVPESSVSKEHPKKDVVDCQDFPAVPETAEWEVLENPSQDLEIRDQSEDFESSLHDDGGSNKGVMTQEEEPLEISPDSIPDENDIFVVQDSTQLLNTNGKDNGLHGFFSSGVKNDFWVSSLETGATYQPDDACNEAAEQINQNQGVADNLIWGNSENVVNRNSRMDTDSPKGLAIKQQEQTQLEVKQVLEVVHSDESDVEGQSWSSGEEPV